MSKRSTSSARTTPNLNIITRTTPVMPAGAPDPYVGECPSWCTTPGEHRYEGNPTDRLHYGPEHLVPLELETATYRPGEVGSEAAYEVETATAYLRQNYRDREAHVHLGKGEGAGMTLTVEEAEHLAGALLMLVEEARAQ